MKINGKKLARPSHEVVVIPRNDGDIIIKAQAVLSYDEFEKLYPMPEPPTVIKPGGTNGIKVIKTDDPKYVQAVSDWSSARMAWMMLQSLKVTDGLEFETVNDADPTTWVNVHKELEDAGFSILERNKILDTIMAACGLNSERIEEATKNFLAFQAAAAQVSE